MVTNSAKILAVRSIFDIMCLTFSYFSASDTDVCMAVPVVCDINEYKFVADKCKNKLIELLEVPKVKDFIKYKVKLCLRKLCSMPSFNKDCSKV